MRSNSRPGTPHDIDPGAIARPAVREVTDQEILAAIESDLSGLGEHGEITVVPDDMTGDCITATVYDVTRASIGTRLATVRIRVERVTQ
mgnify:CR=1 FL=1